MIEIQGWPCPKTTHSPMGSGDRFRILPTLMIHSGPTAHSIFPQNGVRLNQLQVPSELTLLTMFDSDAVVNISLLEETLRVMIRPATAYVGQINKLRLSRVVAGYLENKR